MDCIWDLVSERIRCVVPSLQIENESTLDLVVRPWCPTMAAAHRELYKAQAEAVPHDDVRRLHASQNTNTLVSQHVRVKTLVSKVAHEAVTAKRDTSNHHTRRLRNGPKDRNLRNRETV